MPEPKKVDPKKVDVVHPGVVDLRWIDRDGEKILQKAQLVTTYVDGAALTNGFRWYDVLMSEETT